MKKEEAKERIQVLIQRWYWECGLQNVLHHKLGFHDFYDWIEHHHPEVREFRTQTSARFDIEMWFDQHSKQLSKQ